MNDELLDLLLSSPPSPDVDRELLRGFIDEIAPTLSPKTLKEYISNLRRRENGEYLPLSTTASPLNLAAAGRALQIIRSQQKPRTIEKIEKKLSSLKKIDNQALDVFAELAVGEIISPHYEFEVDHKTGVEGRSDGKDVDIFIPDLEIYCEVKNSGFSRTQRDLKFESIISGAFADEDTTGSFEVDPSKGYKVTKTHNNPNLRSIAITGGGTTSTNFSNLLKNAEKKLDFSQHGIVFITGLVNHGALLSAVQNWHTGKAEENRIKDIVCLGPVSTALTRSHRVLQLEESIPADTLIDKLGL